MEQLFPLLIGLAVFAYKIYENFNKQKKKPSNVCVSKKDLYSSSISHNLFL